MLEGRALLATLQFPTTLSGAAGDTIRVPLNLDDSDNLYAVDVAISYDTTRLEVLSNTDVQRGTVTSDFYALPGQRRQHGRHDPGGIGPERAARRTR